VILVHAKAHGHESGIDVDAHIVHVARIEGDRLASLEGYSSERDARSALGRRCPESAPAGDPVRAASCRRALNRRGAAQPVGRIPAPRPPRARGLHGGARYLPAAVGGGFAWCEVEPLSPTAETPNAATHSAIVAARTRRGVSHVRCRACSHERAPVAPAAAAMAHAAHMARA
jgi:hypothetical protein